MKTRRLTLGSHSSAGLWAEPQHVPIGRTPVRRLRTRSVGLPPCAGRVDRQNAYQLGQPAGRAKVRFFWLQADVIISGGTICQGEQRTCHDGGDAGLRPYRHSTPARGTNAAA